MPQSSVQDKKLTFDKETGTITYDRQVLVDRDTHAIVKKYADEMNVSMASAIRVALRDWFSTVGEARLESHRKTNQMSIQTLRRKAVAAGSSNDANTVH